MVDDQRAFHPSNWREALRRWKNETRTPASSQERDEGEELVSNRFPHDAPGVPVAARAPESSNLVPPGWWEDAFSDLPSPSEQRGHPCGERQVLTIIAYDISEPRRLHRIAGICEDYGMRVQYSVFECRLEGYFFERFWDSLVGTIDPSADRLVAYKVCAACAREIRSSGIQTHQEKVVAYVF